MCYCIVLTVIITHNVSCRYLHFQMRAANHSVPCNLQHRERTRENACECWCNNEQETVVRTTKEGSMGPADAARVDLLCPAFATKKAAMVIGNKDKTKTDDANNSAGPASGCSCCWHLRNGADNMLCSTFPPGAGRSLFGLLCVPSKARQISHATLKKRAKQNLGKYIKCHRRKARASHRGGPNDKQ